MRLNCLHIQRGPNLVGISVLVLLTWKNVHNIEAVETNECLPVRSFMRRRGVIVSVRSSSEEGFILSEVEGEPLSRKSM